MRIAIVGAGLLGITTAYFLRQAGFEVVVIERQSGPALETSFANGALLTPSMSEPWNAPGCWRLLLRSLVDSRSPLQIRLQVLPGLISWGLMFLRNASRSEFERNTAKNLKLALYSLQIMNQVRAETAIDYGRSTLGTLRIFRNSALLEKAVLHARELEPLGLEFAKLSPQETVALEPALLPVLSGLVGAIHYPVDETGDAYQFCTGLASASERAGVEYRYDTAVQALLTKSGLIRGLAVAGGEIVADRYVIAAGSHSLSLLKACGIDLPVKPAKGYSLTVQPTVSKGIPQMPIVDDALHAVIVPLRGLIRVAGTAEFAGFSSELVPARVRNIQDLLHSVFSEMEFVRDTAIAWAGLRPMSADGVPIIGPTRFSNLFLNTGHGHLGWTMAAGSARLLADMLSEKTPAFDLSPYHLSRFAKAPG